MRYLEKKEVMGEAERKISSLRKEIDKLQSVVMERSGTDREYEMFSSLKGKVDDVERLLLCNSASYADYSKEYSRYRFEYERLIGSGSIKLTFALRRLLGRNYRPLPPASLDTVFDMDMPLGLPSTSKAEEGKRSDGIRRFLGEYKELISRIADSNGSGFFDKSALRAGIITDDYMYNYYKDALDFEYIRYETYEQQISSGNFAFILYVTCWNGLEGNEYGGPQGLDRTIEVFEFANNVGVTTIFQSIEDPVNYEYYLDVARSARFVFTTDCNMVQRYKEDLANENVHVLEYGINPLFHNPINIMKFKGSQYEFINDMVFFAGSWYWFYPERCLDNARIFDGVLLDKGHELLIADRHSTLPDGERLWYTFPLQYQKYIVDAFEHADLQKVHKLFDYAVCANTVKDSETMCAMRVYELQALGSLMLSNYALSVSRNFPSIFMVNNSDEVPRILSGYTRREVFNLQVEGIRRMFSGATVYDRLNEVFECVGLPERFEERRVAVLLGAEDYDAFEDSPALSAPGVSVLRAEGIDPFGLADEFDYAVWPTTAALGYPHFVEDALNAFKFVDVDYVRYVDDGDYEASYSYTYGTAVLTDTLFALRRVDGSRLADPAYLGSLEGFSVARAVWGRRTGAVPKELAMIIPIYNNGSLLRDRCFLSLLRSSAFDRMSIYLMDDGSSDPATRRAISELCEEYDNVVSHVCGECGSGSASRPRNVGMAMSSEPYVAFLDPDDEAIGDGYAKLLDAVASSDVDFAIGDIIAIHPPDYEPDRIAPCEKEGVCDDPKSALVEHDFAPRNIQACVFRRSFLERSGMEFALGGFGEDSLYYYEAMLNARSFAYVRELVFTYYMESEGSATNEIGAEFFEKSLAVEKVQVRVLKEHGMLDAYKDTHLDLFMDNWYERKIRLAGARDYPECRRILEEIRALYE